MQKRMCRTILSFICFLFLIIDSVYCQEKKDREYIHLYLYPMVLSEEVKSSLDDFFHCYIKEIQNKHYLELSIYEINQESNQVHYGIKLINSPDIEKLVINEERLGFGRYKEIEPIYRYIGYSYYKNHLIIVSKWYQLQNICNPYIKKSSFPFVQVFLLRKHDVHSPPGVDNSKISFKVSKNNVFKCPPTIEE